MKKKLSGAILPIRYWGQKFSKIKIVLVVTKFGLGSGGARGGQWGCSGVFRGSQGESVRVSESQWGSEWVRGSPPKGHPPRGRPPRGHSPRGHPLRGPEGP